MRRSLIFDCAGETLLGTLDDAEGTTGVLIVTGGRQTRIGPHRMMATLAGELAAKGLPVFRYDRRGVGDSSGGDPGFRHSGPDMLAAATAFRAACPHMQNLWALGLCDGATALALNHHVTAFAGLILLNPWVIESEAASPPPAAIRAHYRQRLLTAKGVRHILRHGFSLGAAAKGIRSAFRSQDQSLAHDVMTSLARFGGRAHILLAERDATARAYISVHRGKLGIPIRGARRFTLAMRDSASHSFAGRGDRMWLETRIMEAIRVS